MKIWQLIEKPTKALLMVSRMKKFFILRNHSLNPSSKVTSWILEEIFHFKIFVSVKGKLLVHLLVKLENWLRYWKSKYVITISYHASSGQCYAKWNDSYSVSMKNVLEFFWNLLHNHLRLQQLYDKLSSHLIINKVKIINNKVKKTQCVDEPDPNSFMNSLQQEIPESNMCRKVKHEIRAGS